MNETVIVGNDVKVTVLDIRNGQAAVGGARVKLGFQAPKEVSIRRQEISRPMTSKTCSVAHRPKSKIAGKRQPVSDVAVRLQILDVMGRENGERSGNDSPLGCVWCVR